MSNDELIKHLSENLREEFRDIIRYADMSKKVNNSGYSQILRDMAHEEQQHANHIKNILADMGAVLPNQEEFNTLCERAEKSLEEM
ncbi:MAG: hypothetical protein K2I00_02145 [Ruminococcus sp.]|nr:hypothetical protein [Ruminococcus sp.]